MKAMIYENSLIVNTFDRELLGKVIFGKILKIDLSKKVSFELSRTQSKLLDRPESFAIEQDQWDMMIDMEFEVFDLNLKPDLMILFEEVSQTWEEYYTSISDYVSLYNKFPEIEPMLITT